MPAANFSNLELHYGTGFAKLDIDYARQFPGSKGDGVKVCVVDRGFPTVSQPWHEDLAAVTLLGNTGATYNTATSNHGIMTLGLIAAKDNNSGYRGMAPNATLYGCPVNDLNTTTMANVQVAINTLGAGDIMMFNIGSAGPNADPNAAAALPGAFGVLPVTWNETMLGYARQAQQKGIITIISVNNGQQNLDASVYKTKPTGASASWVAPFDRTVRDDGLIYVGAIAPGNPRGTNRGTLGSPADFINYGALVDTSFWGYEMTFITRYQNNNENGGAVGSWYYTDGAGTSVATPTVVGVLASLQGALIAAGRPKLTPATARAALRGSGGTVIQSGTTKPIGTITNVKGLYDYFGLIYAPPEIISFTTIPAGVGLNENFNLIWDVEGATVLRLDPGDIDVLGTNTKQFKLTAPVDFSLYAENSHGSALYTLNVSPTTSQKPPTVNYFVASDTSITAGESVTLSWDIEGATNVSLNFGIGTIAGNSIVRTPSGTSTYILTATNEWGSVTQQVTVTVASPAAPVPPVIGEFYASPPQINLGQNTTLIWRTIGADRVRIDGAEVAGSSLLVGPDSTRQYQLSAEGPGGTVTRTLSVKVIVPAVVAGQAAQAHSGLNLGELVDKVYQVCGMDIAETARIEQLLNEAQDEISKLTMAPTKEVKLSMVSGSFQIPEAEYNGILEAHSYVPGNVNAGYPVRLLTTTEASRYFPNWRRSLEGGATGPEYADGAPMQYIIYDPVNVSAPLVPMPFKSSSQDIYVKLHLRPDRMVEYGDLPLNGELPNSHEALWQYVCFQLLNESGDERQTQRGMMAFSRYKALVDRMVSDARPEPVFPDRETASDYSWGELRFGGRGRNW